MEMGCIFSKIPPPPLQLGSGEQLVLEELESDFSQSSDSESDILTEGMCYF